MGRDNHPRERQREQLERKKAKRASYDRVLIICEGKKTEPQYFKEIRQFYRLNTANVEVLPSGYGTLPQQVIEYAKDKLKESNHWEKVFCVFDRDDHRDFENALQSAASQDNKFTNELDVAIRFIAIPSNPCFELWLLLHFESVTKEMERENVIRKLKGMNYLKNYEKGKGDHFALTRDKLETAFKNADVNRSRRKKASNPFTAVGDLVKCLQELDR